MRALSARPGGACAPRERVGRRTQRWAVMSSVSGDVAVAARRGEAQGCQAPSAATWLLSLRELPDFFRNKTILVIGRRHVNREARERYPARALAGLWRGTR